MIMYSHLGISTLQRDNLRIRLEHARRSLPYGSNRRSYEPTVGFYTCVYNPLVIVAQQSESPAYAGYDEDIAGNDVIPLQ